MWAVLGKDNEAAVRGLITTAAHLDRQYCGQLQNLALLSRAKQMLKGAPEAAAEQLATLLREELAAALARDMDGRSLWHMLVAGEHTEALRRLLPLIAAGTSEKGVAGGDQQAADSPGKQQQREANPLNLADALGSTPLHLAAEASQLEATRLLIEAGASLDMQNRRGVLEPHVGACIFADGRC